MIPSRVHFIGIGGIGVSAIARKLFLAGSKVAGSDMYASPVTDELKRLGIEIYVGHRPGNLADGTDLVVHTIAIPETNVELAKARSLNIPTRTYPEMLGELSRTLETVAVSGTHGKTTTTAMLGKIVRDAKLDPTVIVGSIMKDVGSNLVVGEGKQLIVEACEYRRSFLNLHPQMVIITNIDAAHLDYYSDLADVQKAFSELVAKIPKDGYLICDPGDTHVAPIARLAECTVVDYMQVEMSLHLKVPGEHNRKNARAAAAAARAMGIADGDIKQSLENFSGTWRRLEYKGLTREGAHLYDDYAHEPQEVRASLEALREVYGPAANLVVVFRPHLYSRTKTLLHEFGPSFARASRVFVNDIYAARESFDPTIHARNLVSCINEESGNAEYVATFDEVEQILPGHLNRGDIVVTMGAGDIYELAEKLIAP